MASKTTPSLKTNRAAPSSTSGIAGFFGKAEVEGGRTNPTKKGKKEKNRASLASSSRKKEDSKKAKSSRAIRVTKKFIKK